MKLAYDLYDFPDTNPLNDVPPIILIHGVFESRKTWKRIAPALARVTGRKVYAVDIRNHGESPWNDKADLNEGVSDFIEFIDYHNIPRAAIIGHSLGASIAATLALQKPERVEKLVAEEVITDINWKQKQVMLLMQESLRLSLTAIPLRADEETAKMAVWEFMRKLHSDSGFFHDPEAVPLKKDGKDYAWQANMDAIEKRIKKINGLLSFESGVYGGDALFIYGGASHFYGSTDRYIPIYFPRAVKVCFEGGEHLLHHRFQEKFLEEVTKFLRT